MIPALLLSAALAAAPGGGASAAKPSPNARAAVCIQLSNSSDTEYVPVDDHTIVVRSIDRWWKLTTTPSTFLTEPQAFLVNDIRGPSTLCTPLDFDLSVVEYRGGGREGLIVQTFEVITPEEGRALRHAAHR